MSPFASASVAERRDRAATQARRLIVQALASPDWPHAALVRAAEVLLAAQAPSCAQGALLALKGALAAKSRLRLNLVGVLALPGWRESDLVRIGAGLLAAAPDFTAAEIVALRAVLQDLPA